VEVTVSCEGKLRAIRVDPRLLAEEGLELTLDGIVAAANSALALADAHVEKELGKATGGLKIPGLT
jgi:DNA-binding protein YbaB